MFNHVHSTLSKWRLLLNIFIYPRRQDKELVFPIVLIPFRRISIDSSAFPDVGSRCFEDSTSLSLFLVSRLRLTRLHIIEATK